MYIAKNSTENIPLIINLNSWIYAAQKGSNPFVMRTKESLKLVLKTFLESLAAIYGGEETPQDK